MPRCSGEQSGELRRELRDEGALATFEAVANESPTKTVTIGTALSKSSSNFLRIRLICDADCTNEFTAPSSTSTASPPQFHSEALSSSICVCVVSIPESSIKPNVKWSWSPLLSANAPLVGLNSEALNSSMRRLSPVLVPGTSHDRRFASTFVDSIMSTNSLLRRYCETLV